MTPRPFINTIKKDGIMNVFIVMIVVIVITSAIIFLEDLWRGHWVNKYYSFGIRIYDRTFLKDQKTLVDIYAELNKHRETGKTDIITYRLTDENDGILFRNRNTHWLYRSSSLVHGVINCENESIHIAGYLGLTEGFYACVPPYLMCYYYYVFGNAIVLSIGLLVLLGNLAYYAFTYVKTKNRLDDI